MTTRLRSRPPVRPGRPRPRGSRRLGTAVVLALALGLAASTARAQAPAERILRVCADPNNLPFSNRAGRGFENRIAELLARELGERLEYAWRQETRGFVRKGLKAGACDLIPAVPAGFDQVETTRPYFRSTYVFVTRKDRGLHVRSLDDPALRTARIGIHVIGDDFINTPPAEALAARRIMDNVVGYRIVDDYSRPNPPQELVRAVERGDVDVAVVWGPFVGPIAARPGSDLEVHPVTPSRDRSGQRFAFAMALGVRHGDDALRARLDRVLETHRAEIRQILLDYAIPLVEDSTGQGNASSKGQGR